MNRIELLVTRYARDKGISKTDFAKEVGVSRGAMYKWFAGATPDEQLLERLAKKLGTTTADLRYSVPTLKQSKPIRVENWTLVLEMLLPKDMVEHAATIATTVEMFNNSKITEGENDPEMLRQMMGLLRHKSAE